MQSQPSVKEAHAAAQVRRGHPVHNLSRALDATAHPGETVVAVVERNLHPRGCLLCAALVVLQLQFCKVL